MKLRKQIALALAVLTVGSSCFTACDGGREQIGEVIEADKTQLFIFNCNGGVGDEWLNAIARDFEAKHANDTNWETGKKGVQVVIDPELVATAQGTSLIDTIHTKRDYIYFTEAVYYNDWVAENKLVDISAYLNTPLTEYNESESVNDKMHTRIKEYFYQGENIYALPFYDYIFGWYYDADLFREYGFYFKEGAVADGIDRSTYDLSQLFVTGRDAFDTREDDPKSIGADGIAGTYDDGLPVTYDDFYALCDYMLMYNVQPLYWGNFNGYLQGMFQSFFVANEGEEGFYNSFDFDKAVDDLVDKINADGTYTTMSKTASEIAADEALLTKQESRYQALQFLHTVLNNPAWFGCDDATSLMASFKSSNIEAQARFLKSKYEDSLKTTAIFQEGSFWYPEARAEFEKNAQKYGSKASAKNRGISLMPLPRAKRETGKHVFANSNPTCMFVGKQTPDWIMPLVGDFIRFFSTDAQMAQFTKITGLTRQGMSYNVTDFTDWSPFAKSMYYYHENGTFVYPYSTNAKVKTKESYYTVNLFNNCTINGTVYENVYDAIYNRKFSVKDIFEGMYKYQVQNNPKP